MSMSTPIQQQQQHQHLFSIETGFHPGYEGATEEEQATPFCTAVEWKREGEREREREGEREEERERDGMT